MKRLVLALAVSGVALVSAAQNVGIGTNTPASRLHVLSDGLTDQRLQTTDNNARGVLFLVTPTGTSEFGRSGSTAAAISAGLPTANLTRLWVSGTGGNLLIGSDGANSIYLATNNEQRMVVSGAGNIGINTNAPSYLLSLVGKSTSPITHHVLDMVTVGQRNGIQANIFSNTNGSAAIAAVAYDGGGGVSAIEPIRYALVGQTNAATAVAGYTASGTALRGKSATGEALYTSGKVRLEGLGETAGAVLTSDASGNATWQPLQANAGVWNTIGNDIENNNIGVVRVKDFWLQSAFGNLRIGYADKGWYWGTIGGGADLQLWSYTGNYPDASVDRRRAIFSGSTGQLTLNPANASPPEFAQLIVYRGNELTTDAGAERGAILGINRTAALGSGVYGVSSAPVNGLNGFAGVTGVNSGSGPGRIGVFGSSLGSITGSDYSAGVLGRGIVGVLGSTENLVGIGVLAQHNSGRTALEINNGFVKVSGTNKTAFTVTATASNSGGHILALSYANQQATDILLVTHNYNPPGAPSEYHNQVVGVYWDGDNWNIYNENTAIPILNKSFNVLVIKQ